MGIPVVGPVMVGAVGGWFAATVTVVDFVAFGPTAFPQVRVKVVVVSKLPELLLPLAAGVADPTPLLMEHVIVPPPVTPIQLRLVLAPLAMFAEVGEKEPITTLAGRAKFMSKLAQPADCQRLSYTRPEISLFVSGVVKDGSKRTTNETVRVLPESETEQESMWIYPLPYPGWTTA